MKISKSTRRKANRADNKKWLVEKAGGKCQVCEYSRYAGALHFHHLDPTQKIGGVMELLKLKGLEAARKEANKCVLLCANCHSEVHAGLIILLPY